MFLVVLLALALAAIPVAAGPLYTQCPAVGGDSGCAVLITIGSGGGITVAQDATQPPYDGTEDSLVGVVNNSGAAVSSLSLSSSAAIYGFDGDGICAGYGLTCTWSNPTSYEGPGTSFTYTDAYHGTVNFSPSLADGQYTYFGLEESPSDIMAGGIQGGTAPEPASLLLLGAGLASLLFARRRRFAR